MHTPLFVGALVAVAATNLGLALFFARAWQRRHREYKLFALLTASVALHSLAQAGTLYRALVPGDAPGLGTLLALEELTDPLTLVLLAHFAVVYARVARPGPWLAAVYALGAAVALAALSGLWWVRAPTGFRTFELFGLELHELDAEMAPLTAAYPFVVVLGVGAVVWLFWREARRRREGRGAFLGSIALFASVGHDAAMDSGLVHSVPLAELGFLGLAFGVSLTLIAHYSASAAELGERTNELRRRETDLAAALSELARTQRELLQSEELAMVGELAAVVAHEVRNPLAIVNNAVASLRHPGLLPDDRATLLGIIDEEAARLERLASHLKGYARQVLPARVPIDLGELVRRSVARAPERSDVTHSLELEPDVPLVAADGELLREALDNLVANAFQAMPDGGELAIALRRAPVSGVDAVAIEVRDSGEGMSPTAREQALLPFFTTRPTGTGLGLPICDRIVSAHGGTLDIETAPGRGTVVRLTLPVAPGQALPKAASAGRGLHHLP